jgi:hypothetical protein
MVTIAKWAEEAGADQVALVSVPFLSQENPQIKKFLMQWLVANKAIFSEIDANIFVTGLLFSLQDRSVIIRDLAEILLNVVMPLAKW